MWRISEPSDDGAIVRMCLALNAEDPGPDPVPPENMTRTLAALREVPLHGRALVLEFEDTIYGYCLVISCWSNELGGPVDVIDELYVEPRHRGHGYATQLIDSLAAGSETWASSAVALTLEVTPDNVRARRLYERLGFTARNLAMRRRLSRESPTEC